LGLSYVNNGPLVPTAVAGPLPTTGLTGIYSAFNHTCATTSTGALYCWGNNNRGQVGNGSTGNVSTPFALSAPLNAGVIDVANSNESTCVITTGGVPYCWGYNNLGQLGNGNTTTIYTPGSMIYPLDSGVLSLAMGRYHVCAVKSNQAYCWGDVNSSAGA
jgi:alpha-tubulin suppressor-like RCC1 family protein